MPRLTDEEAERMSRAGQRYEAAHHAVQSGVAFLISAGDSNSHTPKMLRTGINMRAVEHAALVRLLMKKGLITELEYMEALADEAEREVQRLQKDLSEKLGPNVKLA